MNAAQRTMDAVYEAHDNYELNISQSLLNKALEFAVDNKYSKIWIEVPSRATDLT